MACLDIYLLDNAQTFIGVLATLVALCLFHDQNNFFVSYLRHLGDEIMWLFNETAEEIKIRIEEHSSDREREHSYWSEIVKQNIMLNHSFLKAYQTMRMLGMNYFVNNYSTLNEKVAKKFDQIEKAREFSFVALFTFFFTLVILFIDCCIPNPNWYITQFSWTFLLSSSVFLAIEWIHFWNKIDHDIQNDSNTPAIQLLRKNKHGFWFYVLKVIITIIIPAILFFVTDIVIAKNNIIPNWLLFFISLLLFVVLLFIYSSYIFKRIKETSYYNRQFVSSHFVYILSSSLLIPIVYWTITLIFDLPPRTLIYSPVLMYFLVVFILLNAFILPFLLSYIKYKGIKNACYKQIKEKEKEAITKIEEAKQKYDAVINIIKDNNK